MKRKERPHLLLNIILICLFALILFIGGYSFFKIFSNYKFLTEKYIQAHRKDFTINLLGMADYATRESLEGKLNASLMALLIFLIFALLLMPLILYFSHKIYLYLSCTKYVVGKVEIRNYKYFLSYTDFDGRKHINKSSYLQKVYKRIYGKYNGEAKVFINALNPEYLIINNRDNFLDDVIIKPMLEVFTIYLIIFLCLVPFHPFLIFSVL